MRERRHATTPQPHTPTAVCFLPACVGSSCLSVSGCFSSSSPAGSEAWREKEVRVFVDPAATFFFFICVDRESRGFAFVTFRDPSNASVAIDRLDGKPCSADSNKPWRVERAKRNKPHQPTPGVYKGPPGMSLDTRVYVCQYLRIHMYIYIQTHIRLPSRSTTVHMHVHAYTRVSVSAGARRYLLNAGKRLGAT